MRKVFVSAAVAATLLIPSLMLTAQVAAQNIFDRPVTFAGPPEGAISGGPDTFTTTDTSAMYGDDCGGCSSCCQSCDQCGDCCQEGRSWCCCRRLLNRWRGQRMAEEFFNCGCNGSYKFPVPPLYTYHWPGLYSQQLMTDYHSPWRFPPLRPYTDEPPLMDSPEALLPTTSGNVAMLSTPVRQASLNQPVARTAKPRATGPELPSTKFKRLYAR